MKKLIFILTVLSLGYNKGYSQRIHLDLQHMLAEKELIISPVHQIHELQDGDKNGITCNGNVWLTNTDFTYGTIELDIRGRNEFLNSFPGIAFHTADTASTYEVVYFRPFNFRSADPVRRTWSVQYMSLPEYPYERLRKDNTGQFESEIVPNPKPEDWIHARIVIQPDSIKVYVNGMVKPSLNVKNLGKNGKGIIGLWTSGTTGDFANLIITLKH